MRLTNSFSSLPSFTICCGLALSLAVAASSRAEPIQVVLASSQHAPTSPKSAIPGTIPGTGVPAEPRFANFSNKLYRSPTSNLWLVVPTTNLTPGAADQVLLIGNGLNLVGGQVAAREGVSATTAGDLINFSRIDTPRVNDSGQWAMSFRPATGGSATNERIVKWNGTELLTVFGPAIAIPAVPGQFFAGGFSSCNITNSGSLGFLATGLPTSSGDSAFTNDGNVLVAEMNISTPSGQSGTATPWNDIDTGTTPGFCQNADGSRWIAIGEVGLDTSRDKVAVVDNVVVIQKGSVIAGSSFVSTVNTIGDVWMESNGDWFVRGVNADGIDWVVRNGVVIAAEGQPIVPGSAENWQTFRSVRGNNRGDWVISGNTNAEVADPLSGALLDDVLVLNGQRVVARESDPVDLDGNGLFDDSLFLHLIQDTSTFNNDGYYYFASRLKSAATDTLPVGGSTNTGGSLLRVFACAADVNGSGAVSVQDIFDFLALYFGNSALADFNRSGAVSVQDIFDYLAAYFTGC